MGGWTRPKLKLLDAIRIIKFCDFGALEETYEDVLGVLALDSSDDSGSNVKLLPGLGQVEVVDTILGALVDVAFHVRSNVLGADVDL